MDRHDTEVPCIQKRPKQQNDTIDKQDEEIKDDKYSWKILILEDIQRLPGANKTTWATRLSLQHIFAPNVQTSADFFKKTKFTVAAVPTGAASVENITKLQNYKIANRMRKRKQRYVLNNSD